MKLNNIAIAIIALFMCSCVTAKRHSDGSTSITAFGGKGAASAKGKNGLMLVWNNEKSFYHAAMAVGAMATAASSAYGVAAQAGVDKASLATQTAQHKATQETARHTVTTGANVVNSANASNAALEIPATIVTPKGY